jgi:transcription elongation factor Elf1
MPFKDPEKRRAAQKKASKKHYEKNKQDYIDRAAETKRNIRTIWQTYKSTLSCVWCGENEHHSMLDFHHVITTDKKDVNRLIACGLLKQAMAEIQKCIPICSNHHRHLHNSKAFENKVLAKVKEMKMYDGALRTVFPEGDDEAS